MLGVGLGYPAAENAAFGVGRGRARLFERKLEIVRPPLTGEAVTLSDPGCELAEARLSLVPAQPPPIWSAADSDRAV